MYPEVNLLDAVNLSKFNWFEIEETEKQPIYFSPVHYGHKNVSKQGMSWS